MLFITHDLAVAQFMAHRVAVMYRGRIVEHGPAEQVIRTPRHPYTRLLLASVPRVESQRPLGIAAAPAIPDADVSACVFADRCWMAQRICLEQAPQLDKHEPHAAACHFA
jgi:oligopeptide/dipeptide ABC transporter ATP-binding protein